MVFLSWQTPVFVSIFIIAFDVYWLLKSIYLSLHLRHTYKVMRAIMAENWLKRLEIEYALPSRDANDANDIRMPQIIEKELSYKINGILFGIHNRLGRFARERQYGDELEIELKRRGINFKRENSLEVGGRKSNFVDFIIEDKIVLELKAKPFTDKEDYYQLQRYLHNARIKLGLLVNFRDRYLKPKRILNPDVPEDLFVDSHGFVLRPTQDPELVERADLHRVTPSWREMHHLIIFPMYKEPLSLVRDSLLSLCKANYPLDRFMVVLAIEESAGEEARVTAREIGREFGDKFYKFMVTVHPANLPGEIPGKGSNESWSAREAKRLLIDPCLSRDANDANDDLGRFLSYDNILVSVFDVDTQIFPDYFGRLTYVFLNAPDRLRAIYQPIPLFTNNIYESPALARVIAFTTSFWQMMQQARPARLTTFSSQSVPLPVLLDIGFWHKDIVSEDSRIFWQCYLHYHGDFRVEPMFYPVAMDANCAPTFWGTMKNIYKQQRRWAWGVENTPYLLDGFRKDPLIPARKKWYWSFVDLEGRHSWATNALIIFALGWLPVALGGKIFNATLLSYNLTDITRTIINISMAGVGGSAVFGILLLPEKPAWFKARHYLLYILQWALIPITLIFFGAFPGLDAQTRLMLGGKFKLGFWVTPKHRPQNSKY